MSEEEAKIVIAALQEIATTMPSKVCLNMNAKMSDPDYVKLRNNHMAIASQAMKYIQPRAADSGKREDVDE